MADRGTGGPGLGPHYEGLVSVRPDILSASGGDISCAIQGVLAPLPTNPHHAPALCPVPGLYTLGLSLHRLSLFQVMKRRFGESY